MTKRRCLQNRQYDGSGFRIIAILYGTRKPYSNFTRPLFVCLACTCTCLGGSKSEVLGLAVSNSDTKGDSATLNPKP